jgi:hypothetical protein
LQPIACTKGTCTSLRKWFSAEITKLIFFVWSSTINCTHQPPPPPSFVQKQGCIHLYVCTYMSSCKLCRYPETVLPDGIVSNQKSNFW